jgi:hypothetical protein
MEAMQRELIAIGATVLTFTLPDLTPVMPIARLIVPRIRSLNDAIRGAAMRTGTILIDFAVLPVGSDPRVWADDRIHANALGHARIADALAEALGLPGADGSWRQPLPPPPAQSRLGQLAGELTWTRRHLLPWIGRGLRLLPSDSCPERPVPAWSILRSGPPRDAATSRPAEGHLRSERSAQESVPGADTS